jgi:hypothetical protein
MRHWDGLSDFSEWWDPEGLEAKCQSLNAEDKVGAFPMMGTGRGGDQWIDFRRPGWWAVIHVVPGDEEHWQLSECCLGYTRRNSRFRTRDKLNHHNGKSWPLTQFPDQHELMEVELFDLSEAGVLLRKEPHVFPRVSLSAMQLVCCSLNQSCFQRRKLRGRANGPFSLLPFGTRVCPVTFPGIGCGPAGEQLIWLLWVHNLTFLLRFYRKVEGVQTEKHRLVFIFAKPCSFQTVRDGY